MEERENIKGTQSSVEVQAVVRLRRCPFCGRAPSLAKGKQRKDGEWLWKPVVRCRPCRITRTFHTVEAAISWWNERAICYENKS